MTQAFERISSLQDLITRADVYSLQELVKSELLRRQKTTSEMDEPIVGNPAEAVTAQELYTNIKQLISDLENVAAGDVYYRALIFSYIAAATSLYNELIPQE